MLYFCMAGLTTLPPEFKSSVHNIVNFWHLFLLVLQNGELRRILLQPIKCITHILCPTFKWKLKTLSTTLSVGSVCSTTDFLQP